MKKINLLLILLPIFLISCKPEPVDPPVITNPVIEQFKTETGLGAVYIVDSTLLNTVKGWQGIGDYPGVDDWATAKIPNDFDLLGGLPGQSEYYTINQTLIDADTQQVNYWERLQVKAHPTFGYRLQVGVFDATDSLVVAISKTLANPQYGSGGGWQIYVENYDTDLVVRDTINLKN